MKYSLYIGLLSILFLLQSCDKTTEGDQLPERLTKRVLLEEFGGEWCSFCAEGEKEFEKLLNQNPDKYIGISIHYDDPFEVEYPDIVSMLLSRFEIIAFPSTIVDRSIDESKSREVQAEYRLSKGADIGINIKTEIVKTNLDIAISYISKTDIDNTYLTVYIVEDSVPESSPGAQSGGGGNFIHRYVLRQVLTKKSGNPVEITKDKINSTTFTNIKLGQYKNSNVDVVAFIHRGTSNHFEVLNTNRAKVNDVSGW